MLKLLANIFVSLFVPKKKRALVKYRIMGWPNRMKIRRKAQKLGVNLRCSSQPITINRKTEIGDHVLLNGLIIQGNGKVVIGNYVIMGIDTLLLSDSHNYEGEMIPFDNTSITGTIEIGDFVWMGSRVTLLPGTKIGEGAIIQAGAVVHGEIPPYAIAGGNPAKVFKMRNVEHFQKLKAECKFFIN